MFLLWILLTCAAAIEVQGTCPHEGRSLKRWSKSTTWPRMQKPKEGDHVIITTEVLLDESPPTLFNIRILRNGRLVFSPDVVISLHVTHILVEGKLEIGSEKCPHEGAVNIYLEGRRGDYNASISDGEKGINVMAGGTLELHGKKKLSWTKLAKTLPRATRLYSKAVTEDLSSEEGRWIGAMLAVTITPTGYEQFTVQKLGVYRIFSNWVVERQDHMRSLFSHFANTSYGDILLLASQRRSTIFRDKQELFDKLETLAYGKVTGNSTIRNISNDNIYSAALQKGSPGSLTESLSTLEIFQSNAEAQVTIDDWINGLKFTARSFRHSENDFNDGASFSVTKTSESYPIIDVIDRGVSSWEEGDQVIITSTDYDWKQVEEGTIMPCPACKKNKQIRIDLEPKFMHWGEVIAGVLDERAEVGLLSRNIRIQGVMDKTCPHTNENCDSFAFDTFGAHIRITEKFENVHVEGVELKKVGQQTENSRYPIHFHMCLDVRNYTHPPYIRSNSIHHSFARCVTIHGTSGVTILDNVCYKFLGHGIFLEEGGEKWNIIDGNLLVGSTPGALIPSDKTPSAFWITNPLNIIRNNHAAGGEGNGIWFLFPDEPIGLSKGLGLMAPMEAHHTAVLEFDNNVIHSYSERGLLFDHKLQVNGDAGGINNYRPRQRPLVESSKEIEVVFSRITAHHNRHSNAWIRGGFIRVTKSSFADSVEGLIFASSNNMVQTISECVFIGDSENYGNPFVKELAGTNYKLNRSVPLPFIPQMPRTGFLFYDGPVFVENVWFNSFEHGQVYKMGALGFNRNNEFGSSPVNSVKNVLFGLADSISDGNRLFFGDSTNYGFNDLDGDIASTFRNYDGTMWGLPFTQTLKPLPFHLTAGCFIRPNANMAFCTEKYGKIRFDIIKGNPESKVLGVRDDTPSATVTQDAPNACEFLTALGGRYSYTFHFIEMVPEEFEIFGDGVEKNEWVRFGLCIPRDAKFDLYTWTPHWLPGLEHWTAVKSIEELENNTQDGKKYHFNNSTGMLYFKFMSLKKRPDYYHGDCKGYCPRVKITILSGNRSDSDCRTRIYTTEQLGSKTDLSNIPQSVSVIPASSPTPPKGWGAGKTRPFYSRQKKNGAYGPWSDWSACTATCGGGVQIRSRQCDTLSPQNGGYNCDGRLEEQRPCSNDACVINGGFSEWSRWTDCYSTVNCQGLQSRKRFCISPVPQGGGTYCKGSIEEVKPCLVCNPYFKDRLSDVGPKISIQHIEKLRRDGKRTKSDLEADVMYKRKLTPSESDDVIKYDMAIDTLSGK